VWFVENYEDLASIGVKVKEKLIEEQTPYQKLEIYDTVHFGKLLTLDGRVMLSDKDEFVYHEMMSHPVLCTHKNPQKVLVVGGGDGGVIREILKHDSIQEVTLCEIDERVTRLSQQYFPAVSGKLEDPRVKLVFQDGIKYTEQFEHYFDIIITDSTDPIGHAVSLFQEDYYHRVKRALKPNGCVICQTEAVWLPVDIDIVSSATKALCHVFKNVQTYQANVPLYPPGFTITFASDTYRLSMYDKERSARISETCKYYNHSLHLGACELPNFVRQIVHNQ
jgi:spermidine synthase